MGIVELMVAYPKISLVVIGVVVTFFSTLSMKFFTNQDHLKSLKEKQKDLQKQLKECQKNNDFCKMQELNKEVMDVSMSLMKASFSVKQMLVTMIPFLILFNWLRKIYIPILGNWWIAWYLISSMVSSSFYRKLLKMA
jgi:uncharacterized membrane protein (DUF106 family)